MKILLVFTQYGNRALDRTFSYVYYGKKEVGERFRVLINFNGRRVMGFVQSVIETSKSLEELEEDNGYSFKEIKEEDIIDVEPLLTDELMKLAKQVADYYLSPLMSVIQSMLPPSLSPRLSSLKGPKIAYDYYVRAINTAEDDLTPKQVEMLRLISRNGEILKKEAGSKAVLDKLVEKGKVEFLRKEKSRLEIPDSEKEVPHEMSLEQLGAYETILNSERNVVLLEGVTGSGKTEVYLRLSEKCLQDGKNVLLLVPEINLTPQMVEYFSRRFSKHNIAILHSGLTSGERYDEYRRIAQGKASIVVGARSAIFAPLKNIGLIIIDEEHVESYKQDSSPYYHAREVAIMRAEQNGAKVVLGSATPSLESRARAYKGVYGFAEMKHRIKGNSLPETRIIDLRNRANFGKESYKLSITLINKIKETMDKNEQTMLLLNRRGYWTTVQCPSCGHIFVCPNCRGNYTYHKADDMLKCHHCGAVEPFPKECPDCHSKKLNRVGYGTERVEKEIQEIFPSSRVVRLDSDTGKINKNLRTILKDFRDGNYDVMVGTQMIAKGHDFPKVTLSAVVLADIGLSLPTYRASERTFELIAQAVGRSGRSKAGEAIIQTYNPDHYAITLGAKQDYEGFFRKEMQERRLSKYPPYVYLILLSFASKNEEKAVEASYSIKDEMLSQGFESLEIIGPLTPYYSIQDGKYRRVILLKFKDRKPIDEYLKKLLKDRSGLGGVDIDANVDPLDY